MKELSPSLGDDFARSMATNSRSSSGISLRERIRETAASGGPREEDAYQIMLNACRALAALHARGVVHGNISPEAILIFADRAEIVTVEAAGEAGAARLPEHPPEDGSLRYRSPERLKGGPPSFEDDVYALALSLWEMFTCRAPEPGSNPRARSRREQVLFNVWLPADKLQQIFRALHEDPAMRPSAEQMGPGPPWNDRVETLAMLWIRRDKLSTGRPPSRTDSEGFDPSAQALLVTYAPNAPELVGSLLPLRKQVLSIGRGDGQDLRLLDESVSMAHAILRKKESEGSPPEANPMQRRAWLVIDAGSASGTYSSAARERQSEVTLLHGSEVQIGECRLALVSYQEGSPDHERARRYLATYDGLTRLPGLDSMKTALDEEAAFARWAEVPLHVARFRIVGPSGETASGAQRAMLTRALEVAARYSVYVVEENLMRCHPILGARTGPSEFFISLLEPTRDQAQSILSSVLEHAQPYLPDGFRIEVTLVAAEPGMSVLTLLERD